MIEGRKNAIKQCCNVFESQAAKKKKINTIANGRAFKITKYFIIVY